VVSYALSPAGGQLPAAPAPCRPGPYRVVGPL